MENHAYCRWPILFEHYNESLVDRYVTVLPPIILDTYVAPDHQGLQPRETSRPPAHDTPSHSPQHQVRLFFMYRNWFQF